jgi:HTH-type transcriptional regulator/antitoxin HigA
LITDWCGGKSEFSAGTGKDRSLLMAFKADTDMVTLIEAYEAKHYPIDPPDPVEAIKFRMDQQALKPKDLEPMIGRRNRVYEVLTVKRKLTMAMVWKLHIGLGIPAESLIRQST